MMDPRLGRGEIVLHLNWRVQIGGADFVALCVSSDITSLSPKSQDDHTYSTDIPIHGESFGRERGKACDRVQL